MFKNVNFNEPIFGNILERCYENEKKGKSTQITFSELRDIHEVLLKHDKGEVFGKIAEEIAYSWNDIESKMINFDDISEFDELGFVINDSTYAAAGAFNHFYRAKGNKVFWFKSGKIRTHNIYIDINESDCLYSANLELDFIDLYKKDQNGNYVVGIIDDFVNTPLWDDSIVAIINGLVNINKVFTPDYPIEYFFTPSDVHCLSNFSIKLRYELWDMVIKVAEKAVLTFSNNEYMDAFKWVVNIMDKMSISPSSKHIIDFMEIYFANRSKINELAYKQIMSIFKDNYYTEFKDDDLKKYIIESVYSMQNMPIYKKATENVRNTFIREMLASKMTNLCFMDQTLRGTSYSGLSSGELDILVEYKEDKPCSIIEALNLKYVDQNNIKKHLDKVFLYDTAGLKVNYILIFYEGKNLIEFWNNYLNYLKSITDSFYPITNIIPFETDYSDIISIDMEYIRNEKKLNLCHICVDMHI